MASEKQMKEGMAGAAATKQKVMIGAVVIIGLVILWQVVGLFSGGGTTVTPSPVKPTVNESVKATGSPLSPGRANAQAVAAINQPQQQSSLRQMPVMSDTHFLQLQQASEEKYISKLNNLEDLKIQREIAETNQAIAAAKLATVTAEKSISDLLTKPEAPAISPAAYANSLATPSAQGGQAAFAQSSQGQQPAAQATAASDYTVISVIMQRQKWSAVIGYQGKVFNASVGDVLPNDGSVVESINKNGVVLKKEGKSTTVSILSGI